MYFFKTSYACSASNYLCSSWKERLRRDLVEPLIAGTRTCQRQHRRREVWPMVRPH